MSASPDPTVSMPERRLDPRDDDQSRRRDDGLRDACPCGRAIVVRGKCAYCLHAEHAQVTR